MPVSFALLKRPYSVYSGEGSSPITHRFQQSPNSPAIATRYLCDDM